MNAQGSLQEALARKWVEHLEAYLNDARAIMKTYHELPPEEKLEIPPNLDLHELEHDESWRSFEKDSEGRCTFRAEENKAGWVRIKNVSNNSPILKLVKAMGRNKIEKVSLGLFEYRLSTDGDFLQRRPLKKLESGDPHSRIEEVVHNVKDAGQRMLGCGRWRRGSFRRQSCLTEKIVMKVETIGSSKYAKTS